MATLYEQIDAAGRALEAARALVRERERELSALVAEKERELEAKRLAALPPVDRSARTTIHGTPEGEHLAIGPDGMQRDYVVLTREERAKGFVRPVRRSYRHLECGGETTMGRELAETYSRDPGFYSGTYCVRCKAHFPVGNDGEFVWVDDGEKVGT